MRARDSLLCRSVNLLVTHLLFWRFSGSFCTTSSAVHTALFSRTELPQRALPLMSFAVLRKLRAFSLTLLVILTLMLALLMALFVVLPHLRYS